MINKKGQMNIGKLFIFMGVAFAFIIVIGIIMFYIHTLSDAFLPVAGNLIIDGSNATAVQAYADTVGMLDEGYAPMTWIPIGIIMALIISILISCFMARNHPVIIIPYVLIVVFAVIFSVPLSNTYQSLTTNSVIGAELNNFSGMTWFFSYLPIVITVIGLLGGFLIVLNMRSNQEEYY